MDFSSEISCLSICERDDQNCNVVEFVQSSLECKIGWIDSVDIGPGEGYGFYRIPSNTLGPLHKIKSRSGTDCCSFRYIDRCHCSSRRFA